MNKNKDKFGSIYSNPVFLLIAFIAVLAALLYFFKSPNDGGTTTNYTKTEGKVTIVEYGDYQCPACIREHAITKQIFSEYKDKVILDYRHFPLPFHEYAQKAAIAAECARDQGKFLEMGDALYEANGNLTVDSLRKYASNLGLNMNDFSSCLDGDNHMDEINEDIAQGTKDNIVGTPTFYINGKLLVNSENSNYLPRLEDFKREIDFELAKQAK